MSFQNKKILFISPCFFNYEKAIIQRLQTLGAEVDFYDGRPSDSLFSKGLIRVNPKLSKSKINRYYQKIETQSKDKIYDYFLLIKGEAIPFWFLQNFKKDHPKTKMIFYTYDTVKEYPKFLELKSYFDQSFSFEPDDVRNYGFSFRPLFFLETYTTSKSDTKKEFDLVFIGSAHTDRYKVGEEVRKATERLGLKSYFYYYVPSPFIFWLKRLFDPHFKTFDVRKLSFKKLNHSEIAEIYQKTTAVLDLNKPFQFGLSMRTFETLVSRKKLVTTNPQIIDYPFYDPQNILIINREAPKLTKEFFATPFKEIPTSILQEMTLDAWLTTIFFSKFQEE